MSEYIRLIGAEEVRAAGSAMASAAEGMSRAAGQFDDAIFRAWPHVDERLARLEAVIERFERAANRLSDQLSEIR